MSNAESSYGQTMNRVLGFLILLERITIIIRQQLVYIYIRCENGQNYDIVCSINGLL